MDAAKQNAIYEQLQGTDSIRLLELQPGRGTEPLRCDLLHVESLSQAPTYACISYAWGDPNDTEEIECRKSQSLGNSILAPSGRQDHGYIKIPITKSLAGALKALRLPTTTRLLWADAVCINQHDKQERNHQVGLMGRIYAECCSVHVWLGPSDEHTARAISFMGKISDFCQYHCLRKKILKAPNVPFEEHPLAPGGAERRPPRTSKLDYRVWDRVWEEHVKAKSPFESLPRTGEILRDFLLPHWPETENLSHFFTRSYFCRVWVIQEVARCRDITVHCGNLQLPWYIVALSSTFVGFTLSQTAIPFSIDASLNMHNAFALWRASQPSRATRVYVTFLDLLKGTRAFHATDPRDKVYGVLGHPISSTDSTIANKYFFGIEPDYRKTALQVFLDVALGSLQYLNSLKILSFVSHWPSERNWQACASWVPQWDLESQSSMLDHRDSKFDAAGLRYLDSHMFEYTILGTSLSVIGARHGSVQYISRALTWQLLDLRAEAHLNPLLDTMANSHTLVVDFNGAEPESLSQDDSTVKQAISFHEQVMAYARTVSADRTFGRGLDSPQNGQIAADFAAYLCQIYESAHNDHAPSLLAYITRMGLVGELSALASTGNGEDFFAVAKTAFHNRRVFKTADGRIGLGPWVLRPEDILCVLQGGNLIYALRKRPHDTGWWFVGECYVYGCMYGELMEGKSWSDDGFEWFQLV